MARFFIDRPIFAWVISIIIMLAGVGGTAQARHHLDVGDARDVGEHALVFGQQTRRQ